MKQRLDKKSELPGFRLLSRVFWKRFTASVMCIAMLSSNVSAATYTDVPMLEHSHNSGIESEVNDDVEAINADLQVVPGSVTTVTNPDGTTTTYGRFETVQESDDLNSAGTYGAEPRAPGDWQHYFSGAFSCSATCDGHIMSFDMYVDADAFHIGSLDATGPVCTVGHQLSGTITMDGTSVSYNEVIPNRQDRIDAWKAENGGKDDPKGQYMYKYWDLSKEYEKQQFTYNGRKYDYYLKTPGPIHSPDWWDPGHPGNGTAMPIKLRIGDCVCDTNPEASVGGNYKDVDWAFNVNIHMVPEDGIITDQGDVGHGGPCACTEKTVTEVHYDKARNYDEPPVVDGQTYNKDHICDVCDRELSQCNFGAWKPKADDQSKHYRVCRTCGKTEEETCTITDTNAIIHSCSKCGRKDNHKDDNQDHNCDVCGRKNMTAHDFQKEYNASEHWEQCSFTGCNLEQNRGPHTFDKSSADETNHQCTFCDYEGPHEFGNWIPIDGSPVDGHSSGHYKECSICHYKVFADHKDDDKNHYCDDCNYKMSEHNYVWTKTPTTHKEACDYCGDVRVAEGNHYDDNEDHLCDLAGCGYKMTEHNWGKVEFVDREHHQATCTFKGCDVKGELLPHSDEKPNQDHKCDECNGVISDPDYSESEFETIFTDAPSNTKSTQHGKKCKYYKGPGNEQGCDHIGELEDHVDDNQDHLCDVCGWKMSEHNWPAEVSPIFTDAPANTKSTQHGKECTFTGCSETTEVGDHVDDVAPWHVCDVCGWKMSEHQFNEPFWVLNPDGKTSDNHDDRCTYKECDAEKGDLRAHYDNDANFYCDYCNWPMPKPVFEGSVKIPDEIPNGTNYDITWDAGTGIEDPRYEVEYQVDGGEWKSLGTGVTGTTHNTKLHEIVSAQKVKARVRMKSADGKLTSGWIESNEATIIQPVTPSLTTTEEAIYTDKSGNKWWKDVVRFNLTDNCDPRLNASLEYSLDGSEWLPYDDSDVRITAEPDEVLNQNVKFRAVVDGDIYSPEGSDTLNLDYAAPGSPVVNTNIEGETNQDVQVTMSDQGDKGSGVKEIQYDKGSGYVVYDGPFKVGQSATITSFVYDNVGNKSTQSITNIDITKEKPNLKLEPETKKITKDPYDITATASPSDRVNGSHIAKITDPDGVEHTNDSDLLDFVITWEVDANGTYEFITEDKAGNKTTASIVIQNFDHVDPNEVNVVLTPNTWTKDSVQVGFEDTGDTADEGTVGAAVAKIQYQFTETDEVGEEWIDSEKPEGGEPYPTTSRDQFGYVHVRAVDLAGNIGDVKTVKIQIDKNNPTDPVLTDWNGESTKPEKEWFNTDVRITHQSTDDQPDAEHNSGLAGYKYKINDGEWQDSPNGEVTLQQSGTLVIKSVDKVGNESGEVSVDVKIDKVNPTADPKQQQVGVEMEITLNPDDDLSGVAKVEFNGQVVSGPDYKVKVSQNGKYPLKVTDNAGNVLDTEVDVTGLVTEGPPPPIIEPNPDVEWSDEDVEVTIRPQPGREGDELYYSTDEGKTWNSYEGPFTVQETTHVLAKAKDPVSELESPNAEDTIQIDKSKPNPPDITTDPEIDPEDKVPNPEDPDGPDGEGPVKGPIDVEITDPNPSDPDDPGDSGTREILYAIDVYWDLSDKELVWKKYDGTPITVNESSHIVSKIVDKAGNESDITHKIILIDNTAPQIELTATPGGHGTLTNQTVTLNYTYTPEKRQEEIDDPNLLPWNHDDSCDIWNEDETSSIHLDIGPSGIVYDNISSNKVYNFVTKDKCGNKLTASITIDWIDMVKPGAPKITRNRTAEGVEEVTITDTGDTATPGCVGFGVAKIEYSTDNGKTWQLYTDKLELTPDDVVKARVTDKAGNVSRTVSSDARPEPEIILTKGPSTVWVKDKDNIEFKVLNVDSIESREIQDRQGDSVNPIPEIPDKIHEFSADIPHNEQFTIKVVDGGTHAHGTLDFDETRVDNKNPVVEDLQQTDAEKWTKSKDITITVSDKGLDKDGAEQDQSRVVEVLMYKDGGSEPVGTVTASKGISQVDGKQTADEWKVTVTENGTYTFKIKDGVGHENSADTDKVDEIVVDHIDDEDPVVSGKVDPDGWTKDDPDLVINASDDSGIIVDIVVKNPEGEVIWEGHYDPEDPADQPEWPVEVPVDENGDYTVTVTDPVGNEGSTVIKVDNIDKIPPVIEITDVPEEDVPMFTPTVTVTDEGSGLASIVIKDSAGHVIKNITCNGEHEYVIDDWIVNVNDKYEITAVDRAGNESKKPFEVTNIASEFDPYLGEAWWNRSKDEFQGNGLKSKIQEVLTLDEGLTTKWYYSLEKVR